MAKQYSKKAKLAIRGVKVGAAFAKIGASKQEKISINSKVKRLITEIKRADTRKRRK